MAREIECYVCGKKLKGNTDSFGPHGYDMCEGCWHKHVDKAGGLTKLLILRWNEFDNGPTKGRS